MDPPREAHVDPAQAAAGRPPVAPPSRPLPPAASTAKTAKPKTNPEVIEELTLFAVYHVFHPDNHDVFVAHSTPLVNAPPPATLANIIGDRRASVAMGSAPAAAAAHKRHEFVRVLINDMLPATFGGHSRNTLRTNFCVTDVATANTEVIKRNVETLFTQIETRYIQFAPIFASKSICTSALLWPHVERRINKFFERGICPTTTTTTTTSAARENVGTAATTAFGAPPPSTTASSQPSTQQHSLFFKLSTLIKLLSPLVGDDIAHDCVETWTMENKLHRQGEMLRRGFGAPPMSSLGGSAASDPNSGSGTHHSTTPLNFFSLCMWSADGTGHMFLAGKGVQDINFGSLAPHICAAQDLPTAVFPLPVSSSGSNSHAAQGWHPQAAWTMLSLGRYTPAKADDDPKNLQIMMTHRLGGTAEHVTVSGNGRYSGASETFSRAVEMALCVTDMCFGPLNAMVANAHSFRLLQGFLLNHFLPAFFIAFNCATPFVTKEKSSGFGGGNNAGGNAGLDRGGGGDRMAGPLGDRSASSCFGGLCVNVSEDCCLAAESLAIALDITKLLPNAQRAASGGAANATPGSTAYSAFGFDTTSPLAGGGTASPGMDGVSWAFWAKDRDKQASSRPEVLRSGFTAFVTNALEALVTVVAAQGLVWINTNALGQPEPLCVPGFRAVPMTRATHAKLYVGDVYWPSAKIGNGTLSAEFPTSSAVSMRTVLILVQRASTLVIVYTKEAANYLRIHQRVSDETVQRAILEWSDPRRQHHLGKLYAGIGAKAEATFDLTSFPLPTTAAMASASELTSITSTATTAATASRRRRGDTVTGPGGRHMGSGGLNASVTGGLFAAGSSSFAIPTAPNILILDATGVAGAIGGGGAERAARVALEFIPPAMAVAALQRCGRVQPVKASVTAPTHVGGPLDPPAGLQRSPWNMIHLLQPLRWVGQFAVVPAWTSPQEGIVVREVAIDDLVAKLVPVPSGGILQWQIRPKK